MAHKPNRNPSLAQSYKGVMNETCAFPGCGDFAGDVHHIAPLAASGVDEVQNLVLLCRRHHVYGGLHHEGGFDREIEIATYKHMQELREFGFIIENREDLREAWRMKLLAQPGKGKK